MAKGACLVRAMTIEPIITVSWVDPCSFAMSVLTFTSLRGGAKKSDKVDISSEDNLKY